MGYESYKDIANLNFSNNHSEPLRDLACMIDLLHYSDYIKYHAVEGNSYIIVEFTYSPRYVRTFASFEGDGIVQFYVTDDGEQIIHAGNIDSHSHIGADANKLRSIFAETLKKYTGAVIHCF